MFLHKSNQSFITVRSINVLLLIVIVSEMNIEIYCEMQMTGHEFNRLFWDSSFSLDLGLLWICGKVNLNLILSKTLY